MPSSPARRRQARLLRRVTPPRPLNAFFLFRQEFQRFHSKSDSLKTQQAISKSASEAWRLLPDDKRKEYHRTAEMAAEIHKEKYPDYIYSPRRQANGEFKVRFGGVLNWHDRTNKSSRKDAGKERTNANEDEMGNNYAYEINPPDEPTRCFNSCAESPISSTDAKKRFAGFLHSVHPRLGPQSESLTKRKNFASFSIPFPSPGGYKPSVHTHQEASNTTSLPNTLEPNVAFLCSEIDFKIKSQLLCAGFESLFEPSKSITNTFGSKKFENQEDRTNIVNKYDTVNMTGLSPTCMSQGARKICQ